MNFYKINAFTCRKCQSLHPGDLWICTECVFSYIIHMLEGEDHEWNVFERIKKYRVAINDDYGCLLKDKEKYESTINQLEEQIKILKRK